MDLKCQEGQFLNILTHNSLRAVSICESMLLLVRLQQPSFVLIYVNDFAKLSHSVMSIQPKRIEIDVQNPANLTL